MIRHRKKHRRIAAKGKGASPLREDAAVDVFGDVRCGDPKVDREAAWLAMQEAKFDTTAVSAGRRFHSPPGTNK